VRRDRAVVALIVGTILAGCTSTPPPTPTLAPIPTAAPTLTPTPSPEPTPAESRLGTPIPSAVPTPSASPSPSPGPAARPTRVAVPALGIDLPVVTPPKSSTWPLCDVAEYFTPPVFQHPGAGGVTYIYAHAQVGMFLPILKASRVDGGKALVGQAVRVWTAGDKLYTYRITRVRRRQKTLEWALDLPPGSLVLQTSEDQYRDGTKVMLQARQVGPPVVATRAEARPPARPRVCGH
jgi:hypothetical protein